MRGIRIKAAEMAVLAAMLLLPAFSFGKEKAGLNIVFIGNSITQGALLKNPGSEAPPVKAAGFVAGKWDSPTCFANCGVSGATTVDFLPATGTLYNRVTAAADTLHSAAAITVFSISLGTNDSATTGPMGSPVLPQQYQTNLKAIIDALALRYPGAVFVVQYPIWYSPTTYNGAMYLKAGLKRLQSYFPRIEALHKEYEEALPGLVTLGSSDGFDLFKEHHKEWLFPEEGNAGTFYLHPNPAGASELGEIWSAGILEAAGKALEKRESEVMRKKTKKKK